MENNEQIPNDIRQWIDKNKNLIGSYWEKPEIKLITSHEGYEMGAIAMYNHLKSHTVEGERLKDEKPVDWIWEITDIMRDCDQAFELLGGSTRHYVRDLLLPEFNIRGIRLSKETAPSSSTGDGWEEVREGNLPKSSTQNLWKREDGEYIACWSTDNNDWVYGNDLIPKCTHWKRIVGPGEEAGKKQNKGEKIYIKRNGGKWEAKDPDEVVEGEKEKKIDKQDIALFKEASAAAYLSPETVVDELTSDAFIDGYETGYKSCQSQLTAKDQEIAQLKSDKDILVESANYWVPKYEELRQEAHEYRIALREISEQYGNHEEVRLIVDRIFHLYTDLKKYDNLHNGITPKP